MGTRRVRPVVTALAAVVLVAGIAVSRSGPPAQRPVRALGPGGNAEADAVDVDVSDAGTARAVAGKTAIAHGVTLGRGFRSRPGSRSWATRQLVGGGEQTEEELRPRADSSVGRSDIIDEVDRPLGGAGTTIALGTGFAGLRQAANGGPNRWSVPPDTVGDVGGSVYVQAVNTVFAVYDKTSGARVFGPATQSRLYDFATQRICASHNDGDPIVVYDEAAGRFVMSQFALDFGANRYYECIAVSKDADPSDGDWWAYQFEYPRRFFNDYPKFGVWPDGYYASFNQSRVYRGNFQWRGAGAIAYERSAMLIGAPAQQVYVNLYPVRRDLAGMLPSDWDSPVPPPAGMPNLFLMFDADDAFWGYSDDQVEFWAFTVDYATPENSTFEQLQVPSDNEENGLDVARFNPWVCRAPKLACVPQRRSATRLDTISDRLMNRLQYWNDGSIQHLVVNHTVRSNDGGAGVRWYRFENATLTANSSSWSVGDQGTFGPGRVHRWMGSAAMNDGGDLAVGFSASSARTFPGIRVAARTPADQANALGAERRVFLGTGSERGLFNRWGDYSSMSVDPTDSCTFWYTQMYYSKTGQWRWATRIQPFTVTNCA